jgi:hypothetical protein
MFGLLLPMSAWGEVVGVKGFGDVDLSNFDCTANSESKLLHRICYNEANRYLIAQIDDDYYESCNVGPKIIDGLTDSEHVVACYNQAAAQMHR